MPEIVGRMPPAGKAKLLDQLRDDDGLGHSRAMRSDLTFVTFLRL